MEFNFPACPGRFETLGKVMGVEMEGLDREAKKKAIIGSITAMRDLVGVTETLGDLGVKKTDIPELAKKAIHDPCLATNPRKATVHDIEQIYEKAF
jgi:alcohol dehydrogenase class IV